MVQPSLPLLQPQCLGSPTPKRTAKGNFGNLIEEASRIGVIKVAIPKKGGRGVYTARGVIPRSNRKHNLEFKCSTAAPLVLWKTSNLAHSLVAV